MQYNSKQRVVGAIVLISLGIIFIPLFLSGPGDFGHDPIENAMPNEPMYEIKIPPARLPDRSELQLSNASQEHATSAPLIGSEMINRGASSGEVSSEISAAQIQTGVKAVQQGSMQTAEAKSASVLVESDKKPMHKPLADVKANTSLTSSTPTDETDSKNQAAVASKSGTISTEIPAGGKKAVVSAPAQPLLEGWVVQLGSFSSQSNANALRDKLRNKGHASFVEAFNNNNKMLYRVRVGPELTRPLAEQLNAKLKQETQIDGLVMQFP